jgi:hypothetical protein
VETLFEDLVMDDKRSWLLKIALPGALFTLLVIGMALAAPPNDLTRYFLPAGDLLLAGASPYALNEQGPFIYWPFGLWVFALLAALPGVYFLLLAGNAAALLYAIRRIEAGYWWLLYPPVLYTLLAGQLDILALLLGVLAWRSARPLRGGLLIALALAIKPQAALFWLLPWLWSLRSHRERLLGLAACGGSLLLPMVGWWLVQPDFVLALWGDWAAALGGGSAAYIGDSPSFWSIGWTVPALLALALWLSTGRDARLSRVFLALGLPALRYYSAVALIGAAPAWLVPIGYVSVTLSLLLSSPFYWLDPLAMGAVLLWQRSRRTPQSLGVTAPAS